MLLAGVIALLATMTASAASAASVLDRDWIVVRSPNFTVNSTMSEKDTLELARYMETFRAAVSVITNVRSVDAAIPTQIYAFRNGNSYKKLGFNPSSGGVILSTMRDYTIVIRDVRGLDERQTILHEYVHFLLRNQGRLQYPRWYDEGLAEYLSSARIRGDKIQIGRPSEHRADSFRYSSWIPIRDIIASEGKYGDWSQNRQAKFYAESWALVHYLVNRDDANASMATGMKDYLERMEAGEPSVVAFESAFGIREKSLDHIIKHYLTGGKYHYFSIDIDTLVSGMTFDVAPLPRPEVALGLAGLAVRIGEYDQAREWFRVALDDAATRPSAEAGLGDLLKFDEQFDAALPHYEAAVRLAPDDPYSQLDFGEYWQTLAEHTSDPDTRAEYWHRARARYVAAWKLDDSMPEAYALCGTTFLWFDYNYDKAVEMLEEAEYLLPSDLTIRLWLAEAYGGAGRTDEAAAAARSVLAWSHADSGMAKRAEAILAQLDVLAGTVRPGSDSAKDE